MPETELTASAAPPFGKRAARIGAVAAPRDVLPGGELPLAGAGPAPQLLTSSPQRAEQLQTADLASLTLRPEATVAGRLGVGP